MAKDEKKKPSEKLVEKVYRDYDNYNWAGQQTDKGSDVRKKGSDK